MIDPEELEVRSVDPQGADALSLLHEAAIEARLLYPEIHGPDDPWPTNERTPTGGVYLVAYDGNQPLACGALRPISDSEVELRRMFVTAQSRRQGLAQFLIKELERAARDLGYSVIKLETGNKQLAAQALYAAQGFTKIPPFGPYVDDPVSVCFAKRLD